MSKITFITQFTRKLADSQKADCVEFNEPSKVKQSLSYATDINTIYENYCRTGKVPLNGNQPIYDENFIKYDNLIEAQKQISEASVYFQNLPAHIRAKYGNSLEKFVIGLHSQDDFLVKEGVLKLKEKENESNVPNNNTTVVAPSTGSTGSTTVIDTPTQPTVQPPATGQVATA